jgi:SAM-dependent methyltransferase
MIRHVPVLGPLARRLYRATVTPAPFRGSADYWRARYGSGGDSGAGSYAKFGAFKAEVMNAFVADHDIASVIELGCGDGNQLALAKYPSYLGIDVSEEALKICRQRFTGDASKTFLAADEYKGQRADLALSLDVVYHLVEDEVFDAYMRRLFDAAARFVVIYSSDTDEAEADSDPHVRHRRFSAWIERHRPEWRRLRTIPNRYPYAGNPLTGSFSDFHIYQRHTSG